MSETLRRLRLTGENIPLEANGAVLARARHIACRWCL